MWFLGAGSSAAAGVPTAYHLIWRFKQMIYCSEQRVPVSACSDLGDPALRARLQRHFDGKGNCPPCDSDEEYAHYFEAAFPSEADRRGYIDEAFAGASPSYGHIALSAMLRLQRASIVWTTNFDPLVEDATAVVYGSSRSLVTATPDTSAVAMQAINEGRFPLLVKLHGDFRSRRLKNTSHELRAQDAQLGRALVEGCRRFGLAVVGYSGRDHSVMDALEEAIADGQGFPSGLFWFHRAEGGCGQRVAGLIERAQGAGIDAHMIEVETFDELMADLLLLEPDLPEDIQRQLAGKATRVSNAPMPSGRGRWPVLRLNALPVKTAPAVCRRVVCEIGGAREVREAVKDADASIVAGRRRVGVIAFGPDDEVRRVFAPYGITDFGVHTIEVHRLRYESAEHGLLYDAIGRALERERPLLVKHTRRGHIVIVDPAHQDNTLFEALRQATGGITGVVPNTQVAWAEAIRLGLEHRLSTLWLLMESTIWTDHTDDEAASEASKHFVRDRLAGRYNATWNSVLDAWATVITGGADECSLRAFGIGDGCDASFTVSRTTAFSRQESAP